jgi:hypothetical protein
VSDAQRPEHDEAAEPAHLRGLEGDDLELTRFADILTALDEGAAAGIDRTEDPSLASLLDTVTVVRASLLASTENARFESFQYDSRRRIQNPLPMPAARKSVTPAAPPWWRRWQLTIAPAATAAAAIITTVFVVGGLSGGGSLPAEQVSEEPAPQATSPTTAAAVVPEVTAETSPVDALTANLTQLSIEDQLSFLQDTLTTLEARVATGEVVDAELLSDLTTATSVLIERLAANPDQFDNPAVTQFIMSTGGPLGSRELLKQANIEPGVEPALEEAQATAQDGVVSAAGYISQNPAPAADGVTLEVAPGDDE